MKKYLFFLLLTVICKAAAQDTISPFVCSYKCETTFSGLKANCVNTQSILNALSLESGSVDPYAEFQGVIDLLTSMDKSKPFPLLYSFKPCASVCNAASITIDSLQYIYYNQDFLNKIKGTEEKQKWAIRCIIAHEIGHHVLGHTYPGYKPSSMEEQRKNELRADHFSAFVIKHFPGATLENAFEGLNTLDPANYEPQTSSQEPLKIYPLLSRRYQAVREGFDSLRAPVTLSMYKNIIDSVAVKYFNERGQSLIFNILSMSLLTDKIDQAEKILKEIKQTDPEFFNHYNLQDSENLVRKKIEAVKKEKEINIHQLSPKQQKQLKKVEIQILQDNLKQLKNESPSEKMEVEKIRNQLEEMNKEQQ
ncbi:ImmA/IrrE family metallo-endopeptidase [Chitinophaga eiseniae]|uniref:Peptidase family M48 n=1 Tax=Chitinophaga eiseniae TaxID=634771 RepID=A0A847STJ4_9BACT|nr:hypothetical protein [Chitinophaga eiseniae]NLR82507.1 hypothetical protein [Chitinophaga eiseniae]